MIWNAIWFALGLAVGIGFAMNNEAKTRKILDDLQARYDEAIDRLDR